MAGDSDVMRPFAEEEFENAWNHGKTKHKRTKYRKELTGTIVYGSIAMRVEKGFDQAIHR